jgi:hypothetical protein
MRKSRQENDLNSGFCSNFFTFLFSSLIFLSNLGGTVDNSEKYVNHMGSGHYSDSPLFRQPIAPTSHYSDSPLLRQPISPTTHYSVKMVKSSIIILKPDVFLLYLTED